MIIPLSIHTAPGPHWPASISQPERTNACSFKGKGWIEFQVLSMLPAQVKGCVSHPFSRTMTLCLKGILREELGSKILGIVTFLGRETSFW